MYLKSVEMSRRSAQRISSMWDVSEFLFVLCRRGVHACVCIHKSGPCNRKMQDWLEKEVKKKTHTNIPGQPSVVHWCAGLWVCICTCCHLGASLGTTCTSPKTCHRIIEWLCLKRTLKIHCALTPCHGLVASTSSGCPGPHPPWPWAPPESSSQGSSARASAPSE